MVLAGICISGQNHTNHTGSACQEFRFGSRELFIRKHAAVVQAGELIELGCQIRLGRRRRWGRCILRRRRSLLLLCLGIGRTLLVGLVILLLLRSLLLSIFLILVMVDSTCCPCDDCRANGHTGYTSSNCSSSHHVDLFSL